MKLESVVGKNEELETLQLRNFGQLESSERNWKKFNANNFQTLYFETPYII